MFTIILYSYDAENAMDNDNFVIVLKNFVVILSLQVAQVTIKKVPVLVFLLLAYEWGISSKKHLTQFIIPHSMVLTQYRTHHYCSISGLIIIN